MSLFYMCADFWGPLALVRCFFNSCVCVCLCRVRYGVAEVLSGPTLHTTVAVAGGCYVRCTMSHYAAARRCRGAGQASKTKNDNDDRKQQRVRAAPPPSASRVIRLESRGHRHRAYSTFMCIHAAGCQWSRCPGPLPSPYPSSSFRSSRPLLGLNVSAG